MADSGSTEGCPYQACKEGICFRLAMLKRLTAQQPSGFSPVETLEDLEYFGKMMLRGCPCSDERNLELQVAIEAKMALTTNETI